jgi:hypothetical protein
MNKLFAVFAFDGSFKQQMSLQVAPTSTFYEDCVVLPIEELFDLQTVVPKLVNGVIQTEPRRDVPDQPTEFHIFDKNIWEWVLNENGAWALAKQKRNRLLQESDWTQLPDIPSETKTAWATYRQALRDITLQPDPFNIVWPTPPQ